LREAVILAIGGIIVGVTVSLAARAGIAQRAPTLPVELDWSWVGRAALIAVVGSLAGALYPAFKAAQKDPIEALAYE
jgi:putative ABC transport system permease protein